MYRVNRPVSILICAILCAFTLHGTTQAQIHHHVAARPSPPSPVDPSAQQLIDLLTSQRTALASGNPVLVTTSSRPLAAYLLREMSKLRLLQGKPAAAVDLDREALHLEDSPDARLELASALLRSGHQKEAEAEAATVTHDNPRNALAWAVQGSAAMSAGDAKAAVDAFTHSLEIQSDVNVAYALGTAFLMLHEKEKADRIFQQIILASGNAAIWHVAAGDAYRGALYLKDAVEEFKKAIAIDPRVGHAEFFLGFTYLQMNEWGPSSQSLTHLRAAVRLAPKEYLDNFYLGATESTEGSDLASSDRHLHVAVVADPNSPEAWLYLGLNAVREKNTEAAKTYLRKAVELTGTDVARNNYQIRRVYAVLGRILVSDGNHVEGDALLEKYKQTEQAAIGNSANSIARAADANDAQSVLGSVAAKASFPGMRVDLPTAASHAAGPDSSTSAQAPPQYAPEELRQISAREQQIAGLLADTFNDLGTAEARQTQYAQALADFQEAERWHPPTPALLRNLGVAAFRVEQFSESARALTLYLDSENKDAANSPHDDHAQMMLAMSLFSLGKFAEADKAFTPVSALALQDSREAYSWAYSLAHTGQQQKANQIADTLVKQDLPSDALSLVCHLYMDTENYEQSVACFRKAYQADPSLKLAHYQVAESLIRLDRPAEAVPELRQEVALSPNNPDVKYSLAFALLQSSQKSEALAILQKLTETDPSQAQAQYQLGKVLLEDGDADGAVKHLELAEKIDPAPDYIHYQLQAAYRKAGRIPDADRELAIYRDLKSHNRDTASPH